MARPTAGATTRSVNWATARRATPPRRQPSAVAGGQKFTLIALGRTSTCGLIADGSAYCWGSNTAGQLGDGTVDERLAPVRAAPALKFASLTAGDSQSCGVTADGTAYCWGSNGFGQLGSGTAGRPADRRGRGHRWRQVRQPQRWRRVHLRRRYRQDRLLLGFEPCRMARRRHRCARPRHQDQSQEAVRRHDLPPGAGKRLVAGARHAATSTACRRSVAHSTRSVSSIARSTIRCSESPTRSTAVGADVVLLSIDEVEVDLPDTRGEHRGRRRPVPAHLRTVECRRRRIGTSSGHEERRHALSIVV